MSEWTDVSADEDTGPHLMARIVGNDAANITQASLTAITYDVHKDGEAITDSTLTIADVVFDTLVDDDPRWTVDAVGYNFLWSMPDTILVNPGTYEVVITFDPVAAGASNFKAKYRVAVDGDLSS